MQDKIRAVRSEVLNSFNCIEVTAEIHTGTAIEEEFGVDTPYLVVISATRDEEPHNHDELAFATLEEANACFDRFAEDSEMQYDFSCGDSRDFLR